MQIRTRIIVGILGMVVILLAFFQTPLMRRARGATWDVWVVAVGRAFGFSDIGQDKSLADRLSELLSENTSLKAELAEYQQLKHDLATPSVQQLRPVPAAIVGRPADTFQSEFIISKGLASGIAAGDPVVVFGTTLVGFVAETHGETARVRTLYHPSTQVTGQILNEDTEAPAARGLVASRLFSGIFITTIPRDVTVTAGQTVVTAADESKVPSGLVLGNVASVESKEHDAYQTGRISVPYDLDSLSAVTVLAQP